jgi:AcrR family transcriptional regulator
MLREGAKSTVKRDAGRDRKRPRPIRGGAREGAGRPRVAESDDAILEACRVLLEKRGYGRLSIDEVAAAAGVAKTTVYRRWPSKPQLVAAAVTPLYQHSLEVPDTGHLRLDLLALVGRGCLMMQGRAGRILQHLVRESSQHPELAEPLRAELYRRRKVYHQVLTRAVARGELRPEVDQDLVAELLAGPSWMRSVVSPAPMPPELAAQIVDAVLEGVARRPRR